MNLLQDKLRLSLLVFILGLSAAAFVIALPHFDVSYVQSNAAMTPWSGSIPAVPTMLDAKATPTHDSDNSFFVNWQDNSSNESRFDVYGGQAGYSLQLVSSTPTNTKSYTETNFAGWTLKALGENVGTRNYYVRACNSSGCSSPSKTLSVVMVPSPPRQLAANMDPSGKMRVFLNWNDTATNELGAAIQRVYVGPPSANLNHIVSLPPDNARTAMNYVDDLTTVSSTQLSGSLMDYYVSACGTFGCIWQLSPYASISLPAAPGAPFYLIVTASLAPAGSNTQVNVRWTPNNNQGNTTNYRVYRKFIDGLNPLSVTDTYLGDVKSNVTSITDPGIFGLGKLVPGTYQYMVAACNTNGCSVPSLVSDTATVVIK